MSAGQEPQGENVKKEELDVTAPQTDVKAVGHLPDAGPSAEVSRKRQSLSDLFTIVSRLHLFDHRCSRFVLVRKKRCCSEEAG